MENFWQLLVQVHIFFTPFGVYVNAYVGLFDQIDKTFSRTKVFT